MTDIDVVVDEGYRQRSWRTDGCTVPGIDTKRTGYCISWSGSEEAYDLLEQDQRCCGRDGFYIF